eukprot:6191159-Pleurochrysis_carterae.AAC.3
MDVARSIRCLSSHPRQPLAWLPRRLWMGHERQHCGAAARELYAQHGTGLGIARMPDAGCMHESAPNLSGQDDA